MDQNRIKSTLENVYFKGVYSPAKHYLQGVQLLHSMRFTGIGGEQKVNDANTKVLVGISDFNGTQLPNDFNGLIYGVICRYGTITRTTSGTTDDANGLKASVAAYKQLRSELPAWLLQSELVFKSKGVEALRIRIAELVPAHESEKVPAAWAFELQKTIKVNGGEDLEIFLNTPAAAALDAAKDEYLQIVIYGTKFAERKAN